MFEDLELNAIEDENTREFIRRLMNMVETLSIENRELKEENQRLRDEINRMKGEQGKPKNKGIVRNPQVVIIHPKQNGRKPDHAISGASKPRSR